MPIGPNGEKRLTNPVAAGVHIARIATGEAEEEVRRPGNGRPRGEARAAALTPSERKRISQRTIDARWRKGA